MSCGKKCNCDPCARMRKRTVLGFIAILVVMLSGCTTPKAAWIKADRSTRETVGREWLSYVEADPKLSSEQKKIRRMKFTTWGRRLAEAEK